MPTDPDTLNLGDRANPAPCGDPDPVACAPDSGLAEGVDQDCDGLPDNDCDDKTPCWCGETDPLYDDEGLDATCDGSGTLTCTCGGDICVCHHHGEVECPGCPDCEDEIDDDAELSDEEEWHAGHVGDLEDDDCDEDAPGWCDACSLDPCSCDDGPDDLSDLGPLDEDEENPDV